MTLDSRVTLMRDDVADARLEGLVRAERFVAARRSQLVAPVTAIRAGPDPDAEQIDQLLFGEGFDWLESDDGFVFGQAIRDGYVGWVAENTLSQEVAAPTHWVSALRTFAFKGPSIKAATCGPLSLNALVTVTEESPPLARATAIGWIPMVHLTPVGIVRGDPAAVAVEHLGAPYVWGGRDSTGLDCSGLVQQAFAACGFGCPRDTDQQQALGEPAPTDALARGDLVFWRGHVAVMVDSQTIVHANAHHMAVAIEPLADAIVRIAAGAGGEPVAYRRLRI
jgi:cell wall-associated NlpC family hydrolase